MTWLPHHTPITVYYRDEAGRWVWKPLLTDDWNALIKANHQLAWTLWDAGRTFLEESIRAEWDGLSKRERQLRYAEHKAARALRTEAKQAKALTI